VRHRDYAIVLSDVPIEPFQNVAESRSRAAVAASQISIGTGTRFMRRIRHMFQSFVHKILIEVRFD
jgi:hypothetical protein